MQSLVIRNILKEENVFLRLTKPEHMGEGAESERSQRYFNYSNDLAEFILECEKAGLIVTKEVRLEGENTPGLAIALLGLEQTLIFFARLTDFLEVGKPKPNL